MFIPSYINDILNILYTNGFSAFLVGGCVRDYILGRSTNDYDITTNATPSEMLGLFGGYEISDCGIKHGTVCVIICGHMVEITTFRKDVGYDDNRHPNKVFFANNLEDDLARRDFTINAMAYSQQTGIVDIFGGINDIEKGIIRCVGDPVVRFNEDALRIMRCVRFSSQLGFNIERSTYEAMEQCKQNIAFLSKERILSELYKTLCGDFVADTMLKNRDIIFEIIPELKPADGFNQNSPYHIYDVFEHTIRTIPHVPKDNALRLTMLLHDIG
ncbi:MAG: CCA tRNA nucleotidyltransferase, partial [Oscillospiraceae bacterium]